MLDRVDEPKTDGRHYRGVKVHSADVERGLNEAHRHEDGGSKKRHPTCQAQRRSGEVNQREGKKHDQDWTDRLQPCSPEGVCKVLLTELDQLSAARVWWRAIVNREGDDEQHNAGCSAQSAEYAESPVRDGM